MVRDKRGERERREVREGECTGGQWDPESSTLIVIRDGGCWRHLVVAVRGGGCWCRLLVVIRFRSPLPSFATCFASLALCLALGEVESAGHQMILGPRCWWCHISCVRASSCGPCGSCVVFMGGGCRLGLLCALRVLLFGGHGHLLDGCCHSWVAGIVSVGGLCVTLHLGDVVAKQM